MTQKMITTPEKFYAGLPRMSVQNFSAVLLAMILAMASPLSLAEVVPAANPEKSP